MRILEVTNYSAGACGVGARAKHEAMLLAKKGYYVRLFSSNSVKGSTETAPAEEMFHEVKITRFPAVKLGGESFMSWDYSKEALEFKPDIIIAHSYRHSHTTKALEIGKKIGAKVFLVTHAPFVKGNITRGFFAKIAVWFYDTFKGPKILNGFDKVIAISQWEIPYLKKLGVHDDKIVYIPNGIPDEFFTKPKKPQRSKILFFGRISPIKDLETLIEAVKMMKNKVRVEIVGPAEEEYRKRLQSLIDAYGLQKDIVFGDAIYSIKEKIEKMDSASIFVLPSKREAMPQALIEAMARERIVVASYNQGTADIIDNEVNGYLFEVGNAAALAHRLDNAIINPIKGMAENARRSVDQFRWSRLLGKIEKTIGIE
ncbi:glycosyltransferase family 4 protein [Candidatus Pacearchaeota archaeon]|nr:glycosyltransferase family 4 protein [Candidatus Pacearchaeota archaeon]